MFVSILDIPAITIIGFSSALVYKSKLIKKNKDWYVFLGIIFIAIFWTNSILSNIGIIDPWIISPLTTQVNTWIGLFYILSYPLWFMWGGTQSFRLFGRSPEQGGVLWLFRLGDPTEPFKPAWRDKKENLNKASSEK